MPAKSSKLFHAEMVKIDPLIHEIRGERVIFDSELAIIYEVPTKRLNQQVHRNRERFPADFMFQLTSEEAESADHSRLQIATLKKSNRGAHRTYLPYAFSEHGVIMAAKVLNCGRAV